MHFFQSRPPWSGNKFYNASSTVQAGFCFLKIIKEGRLYEISSVFPSHRSTQLWRIVITQSTECLCAQELRNGSGRKSLKGVRCAFSRAMGSYVVIIHIIIHLLYIDVWMYLCVLWQYVKHVSCPYRKKNNLTGREQYMNAYLNAQYTVHTMLRNADV